MTGIEDIINKIIYGDCLEVLKTIPDNSIQMCVTSPPYFGLRDYGTANWIGGDEKCDHINKSLIPGEKSKKQKTNIGSYQHQYQCPKCGAIRKDQQIGLEETPEIYVQKLVEVFREVKRVLKDDGTLWLNLGDSYNGSGKAGNKDSEYFNKHTEFGKPSQHKEKIGNPTRIKNLKPKDLIGIPWRIAFALQVDGWWLRQDIIWHKPNPMPESVVDRCTKSHEYIFLLSKSSKYYFDNEAIKEKGVLNSHIRNRASNFKKSAEMDGRYVGGGRKEIIECDGFRNKRSVFLADDEYMILKKDLTFATKQHIIEEMIKRELL